MPYEPTPAALAGRALLGDRLKYWREQRDFTQENLAHAAGLDRSFYVELEHGQHSCAVDRLFDLADALGVQPAELLTTSTN